MITLVSPPLSTALVSVLYLGNLYDVFQMLKMFPSNRDDPLIEWYGTTELLCSTMLNTITYITYLLLPTITITYYYSNLHCISQSLDSNSSS